MLLISIGVCELVGLAATPFTINAIPTWFVFLHKPIYSPPNWVFGPVWTILYFLMGIAAYLVWVKGIKKKIIREALLIFTIQLLLNFLWSLFFFEFHSPVLGLVDIVLLLVSIMVTMLEFDKISKAAAYLLIPYLLWVSFAYVLNFSIFILNP